MEIVALRDNSVRGDADLEGAPVELLSGTGFQAQPSPPAVVRTWQEELKRAVRDVAQLIAILELPPELVPGARKGGQGFPLFAPWPYIRRIEPGNPSDPLLRQLLPVAEEQISEGAFTADPVGDSAAELSPGLLQKYASRGLLIATGACAIHCRYCFRRAYPYSSAPKSPAAWQPAIDRLAADHSIDEAILSGGDPLTLPDLQLADLVERLERVPHLRRLRIHSRLPVVIPQRVTDELLAWLTGSRLTPIVVIHANHPAEIDAATAGAVGRLVDAGVPVLNQAVLLRGVNDDAGTLVELSRRLVDLRVMPYYLHQLDRVAGAAHFEVSIERGAELVAQMRRELPGYAVPRYVQEIAGEAHKRVLA